MKKLTINEFTNKAKSIHGGKYDYSKVDYVNAKTKVCIICPKHGEFWQAPLHHLNGQDCPKCKSEKISIKILCSTGDFIKKAKKVHGNLYNYSKVEYKGCNEPVCIICPEHGEFWQTPRSHLQGNGCVLCGIERRKKNQTKTTSEFVSKAEKIHGGKYDYSKANYINVFKKVCIICPEHGEFWQTPDAHLHGSGCQKCKIDKIAHTKRDTIDNFIIKAKNVHGNKYDYSKAKYINCDTPMKIVCPEHGEFLQSPYGHLHSSGCPYCRNWKLEEEIAKFLDKKNILYVRRKNFDWLGKQHVDIYIPSFKSAIECQGIQHFKPVNYFGGFDGFEKRTQLDKKKNILCKKNGVKLFYYSNLGINYPYLVYEDKEKMLEEIKKSTS